MDALLAERAQLIDRLMDHLVEQMPEIVQKHVEEPVRDSLKANLAVCFDQLARRVPLDLVHMSPELIEHTRAMVHHGLASDAVMRGYRLTTVYLVDHWISLIAASRFEQALAFDLVKDGTRYLWNWAEAATAQLATEYQLEANRLSTERSQARLAAVRNLLSSDDQSLEAATRELGYRFGSRHLAVVLRAEAGPRSTEILDAALRDLTRDLHVARLTVHAGAQTLWCWLECLEDVPIGRTLPKHPVIIGVGRVGQGIEGFRRSHHDAVAAVHVGEIANKPRPVLHFYAEVELAALCTVDPSRARDFIRENLGDLAAADSDSLQRRATLASYLEANCNYRAAAAALGIHHNTIRYRLEQIERRLGRGISENRLMLEVALNVAETLGFDDGF
ncbi:PucR family transcriptional regulator [Nocardia fluminea]|uniref:PucR family transcriptional regulator n=1 Tax=Nocardia fluminea TaxID=134984 RepID=UPI0033E96583